MAKKKKDKVEQLVGQLIKSELETQLSRLVRKAKRKALREAGKLNDMLQLTYTKDDGFIDAEVVEDLHEEVKKSEVSLAEGEE